MPMEAVPDRFNFPKEEEKVLEHWKQIDAFKTSLKRSEGKPPFTFYDGPPFATGKPHYGHLLAGTIKDVVTRFATQTGHYVERRFGWDTHGLPVEHEINTQLNIKTKEDVLEMGIDKYNAECRKIVMRYSSEWENVVTRSGRWIDFENDYKTLDTSFMESVWWVFGQLNEKGLVYRGYKVMPYSMGLTTPLSNFEANSNYKDAQDPAVVVTLPLTSDPDVALLAWTTTPWTLPSNLALCVNEEFEYVKIKNLKDSSAKGQVKALMKAGAVWIIAKSRLEQLYKKGGKAGVDYEVLQSMKGSELVGLEYTPLFDYFTAEWKAKGAFRVLSDTYVTDDSGTGIVHQAPGFGEDDYRVCSKANICRLGEDVLCPLDANGNFFPDVTHFAGVNCKKADRDIIKMLKEQGRLLKDDTYTHSYPFCWRSDTPLIYRVVPSWFISVTTIKERLLACNEQTRWVPSFVKEKRFHNWLADARDWAVSRNRYWGTPVPIWVSDDGKETRFVSSVQELEELSGVTGITDLHRDSIDNITIPSRDGTKVLRRVEEVFDCWFESGSMPYAQQHYPFENKDKFMNGFPADFIAEGLDQTRGWFYTLMVLSTALFNKPAFKNVIVNGLVLASDGKKMSKRLKNYPDPISVVDAHGADALRLYLINSPVVRAEPLRFQEKGVKDVVKDVFLPWFNAYRFFCENTARYEEAGVAFQHDPTVHRDYGNDMDRWILASLQTLTQHVRDEMAAYKLYNVTPGLLTFISSLTNWYVRFNRNRLRGQKGADEAKQSLHCLFHVLYYLTMLMAPFTPFLVDNMYQNLKKCLPEGQREDSVHYLAIPEVDPKAVDADIERRVAAMQNVIDLGRAAREKRRLPLKTPLQSLTVVNGEAQFLDDVRSMLVYVKSELNVREVVFSSEIKSFVHLSVLPSHRSLGRRLGKDGKAVKKALIDMSHDQVLQLQKSGTATVAGHEVTSDDYEVQLNFQGDAERFAAESNADVLVVLDTQADESLMEEGAAREVVNRVQKLRKKAGLTPLQKVDVYFSVTNSGKKGASSLVSRAMRSQLEYVRSSVRLSVKSSADKPDYAVAVANEQFPMEDETLQLWLCRPCVTTSVKLMCAAGVSKEAAVDLVSYLVSKDHVSLLESLRQSEGKLTVQLDGTAHVLESGKHFHL